MAQYPGIVVKINGALVARVSSQDLNIITLRLDGDTLEPGTGCLNLTGGYYSSEPGATRHMLWLIDHVVNNDDEVLLQFEDVSDHSHPGETIETLYGPPKSQPENYRFDPAEAAALVADLENEPRLHAGFHLQAEYADGGQEYFEVRPPDYSYSISLMWKWTTPEVATLRISSATVQNLVTHSDRHLHLRKHLSKGEAMRFRIKAISL